jgi:hypothetical protein
MASACGGDDGGGSADAGGSGGSATCTVTATATPNTANRTIAGKGDVTCDATATIALEVCVQWNPSGTFADIMCMSSTMSGVGSPSPFSVTNTSSCGFGTGRMYRTRVNAMVNGTAKPEVLSSTVGCE